MWKHSGRWSALYKSKRLLHVYDPWLWRILIGECSIKNPVAVSIWTPNTKNLGLRPQINPLLEIIKSICSSNKTLLYLLYDRMVECSMFCGGGVGMEKNKFRAISPPVKQSPVLFGCQTVDRMTESTRSFLLAVSTTPWSESGRRREWACM